MNRNTIILLLVAAAIIIGVSRGQTRTQAPSPAVGRFQLVNAEYAVSLDGSSPMDKGVFRIDTETGETKVYLTGVRKDGSAYAGWRMISEKVGSSE